MSNQTVRVKLTRAANAKYHGVSTGTVVALEIEEYLKGVVPSEIYENRTPEEAKRAQAICARTYALQKAMNGAELVDTPMNQSYNATKIAASPKCAAAVEGTRGQVLTYNGQVIQCYYSNSNGGETKRTDQVWSAKLPYYQNVPDPWDVAARAGKNIKASHGVGLSQVGAEYAAGIGKTCAEILTFYYPGTEIRGDYGKETQTDNAPPASVAGITAAQLAAFVIKCFEDGVKYWYGTCYYQCTNSLLTSKTKQYPSHYTAARLSSYRADIAAKAMCCDCIGLIKGAVWSNLGTTTTKYGANGCPDKGANGMLEYCKSKKTRWGGMDTFPDTPGLMLHKDGHVGVSIGGGYAIEAKSFADDLVRSAVDGRGWTTWAALPFITYGTENDGNLPTPVQPDERTLGSRLLRRGMKGEDVAALQTALVALGFDCGNFGPDRNGVDGDYGYSTEAAVKAFQRKAGITADGEYGPDSHAALLRMQEMPDDTQDTEDGSPSDDNGAPDAPTYAVLISGITKETADALLAQHEGAILLEDYQVG